MRVAPEALTEAFAGFQAEGKKARNAAITAGIARTLPYDAEGAAFFAQIETLSGARIRDFWTPTATGFFSRVSADYLTDLWAELLQAAADDNRVRTFKALKKGEKAAAMERLFCDAAFQDAIGVTAEQRKRLGDWLPAGLF